MTNEQQEHMAWRTRYAVQKLQDIEAGNHPEAQELRYRRLLADFYLCSLLHTLLPLLPNDLCARVQACWTIHEHIWSTEYMEACHAAQRTTQKEASPQCLQAQDSL